MNRQLVAQQMTTFRGFDRIDVADNVGNCDIGRREFFDKPRIAANPIDRRHIAMLVEHAAAVSGDWTKRIVVDFGAGDDRDALVEQIGEQTNDASLCLAAKTEQDDVVSRQNGVDELRYDGIVIADNAGEKLVARSKFLD